MPIVILDIRSRDGLQTISHGKTGLSTCMVKLYCNLASTAVNALGEVVQSGNIAVVVDS